MRRLITALLLSSVLAGCSAAPAPQAPATAPDQAPETRPPVEAYFTRTSDRPPEQVLVQLMNGATRTIDVAVYQLSQPSIIKAIIDAHKRGVAVRVLSDQTEYDSGTNVESFRALTKSGVPLKVQTHRGKMHLKVSIIDQEVVTTGSFNYTISAATRNDEVFLVIRDPAMALKWTERFEQMWSHKLDYKEFTAK